jgi:non-heme chloroperoxidase
VVLLHGWPVASPVWEHQARALRESGHRVITIDRRGFGRSTRCAAGLDLETLADDLHQVISRLDLRDCCLVGYDLGCAEVLRYLGNYGSGAVRSSVLIAPWSSASEPAAGRATLSPSAVDVVALQRALRDDRHDALERYVAEAHRLLPNTTRPPLSPPALRALCNDAATSGPAALQHSLNAWPDNVLEDAARVGVPTLVLHGSDDCGGPSQINGTALAAAIGGAQLQRLDGAPRGLLWTHAAEVNAALLAFLV